MDVRQRAISRPLRVQKPAPKVPAARGFRAGRLTPAARVSDAIRREFRRGLIVTASTAALLGGIIGGGYGVHAQMTAANERMARYHWQIALATRDGLREGEILFVPIGGNVCRRRVIDNTTWTVRDGGEVECDSAVGWNSNLPETQYQVGLRMDAVSRTFRNRNGANPE